MCHCDHHEKQCKPMFDHWVKLLYVFIFFRGPIPRIPALSWKVFYFSTARILSLPRLCIRTLRDIMDKEILPDVDFEWACWWNLFTLFSQSGSWSPLNTSILRSTKHWSSLTLTVLPSIQPDLLLRHNGRFKYRTICAAKRNSQQTQTLFYRDRRGRTSRRGTSVLLNNIRTKNVSTILHNVFYCI